MRSKLTVVQSCAKFVQRKLGKSLLTLLVCKVRRSQKQYSCTVYWRCENFYPPKKLVMKQKKSYLKAALERHLFLIKNKPKLYIGLPANGFINLLSKETNISVRNICSTLSKIKLSDTFSRLGDSLF